MPWVCYPGVKRGLLGVLLLCLVATKVHSQETWRNSCRGPHNGTSAGRPELEQVCPTAALHIGFSLGLNNMQPQRCAC